MQGIGVLGLVACALSVLVFQAHGGYGHLQAHGGYGHLQAHGYGSAGDSSNWFYQDVGAQRQPQPFRKVRHHSGYRGPESRASYGPLAPSESRASYGPLSSAGHGRRDGPRGPRGPHRRGDKTRRPLSRYVEHKRPLRNKKPRQSRRDKPKPYRKKEKKCCPTTTARFSLTNSADDNSPLPGVAVTIPSIPQTTFVTDDNGEVDVEIIKKLPFILDYTASKDDASVMGTAVLIKSCSVQLIPASISCISTIIFTVTNAADNSPLSGVTMSIDSNPPAALLTDANGEAQIEITEQLPSSLEYSASIEGFINFIGTVSKACSVQSISVAMTPVVGADRVELSWLLGGDLDIHVVEYANDDTSCETSWAGDCSDTSLFLDDTAGDPGLEIIDWNDLTKRYLIFTDPWSRDVFPDNTGAEYRLYGLDGSVYETISAPVNPDNKYWVLGCFDGTLGLTSLNVLNIYTDNPYILDCTPLGLETIIPPSATDNWVIDALAANEGPKGP